MIDILHSFMREYCRFLSKDLIATLDGNIGRNEKVIYEIMKIYYIITLKSDKITLDVKRRAINIMKEVIDNYLHDGDTPTYSKLDKKLSCSNLNGHCSVSTIIFNKINKNFDEFLVASTKYKNQKPEEPYFKQSMIEFNNMLSHLYSYYCNEIELKENIIRSNTHLHRGTLDFYKTLIRDKKSGLTITQKDILIDIRLNEVGTIGKDIKSKDIKSKDNNKKILPIDYKDFVNSLYK